jgi:[protein-PII] uridylyltransferase
MEMTGGQPAERRTIRVERAKAKLRERLSDWDEPALEHAISSGYPDYWLAFDTDDHTRHFEMMREAERKSEMLHVQSRHHPTLDVTEVVLYAPDHPGLFSRIAGAMALTGASVVDAKIFTLANGMALDTFWIQDVSGRAFDSPERIARLTTRIEQAVKGRLWPARELKAVRANALPSRTGIFTVSPAVIIDNKASTGHTVIEVNARDRQGLLHDVTSAITDLNLQIVSAHVSTYGERAVDVFYVKDVFGLKVDDPSKLRRIERRVRAALSPPDDRAASPGKKAAAAE